MTNQEGIFIRRSPPRYRFYYIDERLEDGGPAYANITGPGHADICWQLSQETRQGEWRVK